MTHLLIVQRLYWKLSINKNNYKEVKTEPNNFPQKVPCVAPNERTVVHTLYIYQGRHKAITEQLPIYLRKTQPSVEQSHDSVNFFTKKSYCVFLCFFAKSCVFSRSVGICGKTQLTIWKIHDNTHCASFNTLHQNT